MARKAKLERKSNETEIVAELNIDGTGKTKIKTNIGILDHMLDLFAFHGCFDLTLEVKKADLKIDIHHTNEDIGIVLGKLFKKALGEERAGIKRFGAGAVPMENTLGKCIIDVNGRGHLSLKIGYNDPPYPVMNAIDGYAFSYLEHFLESFVKNLGATLHAKINYPSEDLHTNLETIFKALGLAIDEATTIDKRKEGKVPSTKGIID
jgi:imidazoleglycerol-phosphate dehydratase